MNEQFAILPTTLDPSTTPQMHIFPYDSVVVNPGYPKRALVPLPIGDMLAGCYVIDSSGNAVTHVPWQPLAPLQFVPIRNGAYARHSRLYMNNMFTRFSADLHLHIAALNPAHEQKYMTLGGGNIRSVAVYIEQTPFNTQGLFIQAADLFDMNLAKTIIMQTYEGKVWFAATLEGLPITQLGMCPLLRLSSYSNNFGGDELVMARLICEEAGINPSQPFNIDQSCPIQFSCQNNQFTITEDTYWATGEDNTPYYRIEQVKLTNGEVAFLPVQYVCKTGCQAIRPMFLPPAKLHFVNEWQIGDQSRPLVITSHMEMIGNGGRVQIPEAVVNVISDYDMAGNIDRLPWELLRGMTVYYLLLYNEATRREELDLAIKVCAKIRDAGYGHPRVIDCNGCAYIPEIAEVFTDQEFGRLIDKHGLAIDLCGFKNYEGPKNRLPSEPTAIPYVKTTELFLVVGEPKAGKTWSLLHHLLQIAFNGDKPARALYVYGEGEKAQIEKMIRTLAAAMGISKGTPGAIQLLDARDVLGEGEGVFDLIDAQCGVGLVERIKYEKEQARGYPLRAVGFDNYASLAGKGQVGDAAAVSALRTLGKVQNLGIAVFLACHTNREGLVAASEQFERRANGSILVTKKAPWQEELEQQWLARTKKVKPDAEEVRDMLINEIEEASRFRDCITTHISFQRFRGEQPDGYEMQIQLSAPSLLITPVTPEIKKAFVDELAKLDSDPQVECTSNPEPVKAIASGLSLADLDAKPNDDRVRRLSEIVREGALQTRAELAEILICSESSLDRRMSNWTIANKDIGLQDRRGRKAKNE